MEGPDQVFGSDYLPSRLWDGVGRVAVVPLPFGAGGEEFGGLAHVCLAVSLLARRVFLLLLLLLMGRGRRGGR